MPSSTLVLLVVAALILVVLVIVLLKAVARPASAASPADGDKYELRPTLLSAAERSFAGALETALPPGISWLAKIRLGDLVKTRSGLSAAERARCNNRINQKHVDFVLVRASDLAPLAAIELDDRSHDKERRKVRDAFVDDVLRAAGLPLLHLPAQATYSIAELQQQLGALLPKRISV